MVKAKAVVVQLRHVRRRRLARRRLVRIRERVQARASRDRLLHVRVRLVPQHRLDLAAQRQERPTQWAAGKAMEVCVQMAQLTRVSQPAIDERLVLQCLDRQRPRWHGVRRHSRLAKKLVGERHKKRALRLGEAVLHDPLLHTIHEHMDTARLRQQHTPHRQTATLEHTELTEHRAQRTILRKVVLEHHARHRAHLLIRDFVHTEDLLNEHAHRWIIMHAQDVRFAIQIQATVQHGVTIKLAKAADHIHAVSHRRHIHNLNSTVRVVRQKHTAVAKTHVLQTHERRTDRPELTQHHIAVDDALRAHNAIVVQPSHVWTALFIRMVGFVDVPPWTIRQKHDRAGILDRVRHRIVGVRIAIDRQLREPQRRALVTLGHMAHDLQAVVVRRHKLHNGATIRLPLPCKLLAGEVVQHTSRDDERIGLACVPRRRVHGQAVDGGIVQRMLPVDHTAIANEHARDQRVVAL